jgi:hypothetical protein
VAPTIRAFGRGLTVQSRKFALHRDFHAIGGPERAVQAIMLDSKRKMKSNMPVDTTLQLEKPRILCRSFLQTLKII